MFLNHLFVSFVSYITFASSHTYLLTPPPRINELCSPLWTTSNCCADKPTDVRRLVTYTRGQLVLATWGRNNHIGGFIRFSIVPLALSDSPDAFNEQSIFQYNCYAPNCVGRDNNFFGPDPPGTPFNGIPCSMYVKIPTWLPAGYYTIQWRWQSGGDNYNTRNLGLLDWKSCHDFRIQGGSMTSKPQCPLFIGGDRNAPNLNACEFFKSNDINTCTAERNCFGWYAKAPPKPILQCPTNILPGGMVNALQQRFETGRELPLYIGISNNTNQNPGGYTINLNVFRAQQSTTNAVPNNSGNSGFYTNRLRCLCSPNKRTTVNICKALSIRSTQIQSPFPFSNISFTSYRFTTSFTIRDPSTNTTWTCNLVSIP